MNMLLLKDPPHVHLFLTLKIDSFLKFLGPDHLIIRGYLFLLLLIFFFTEVLTAGAIRIKIISNRVGLSQIFQSEHQRV